jgi:RND family efflux transporter MFP subunit
MLRHLRPLGLSGPLLLAALTLGCGKGEKPAEEESHSAPVEAVAAKAEKLGEWTELLGNTQPLPGRIARVSANVEGHVLSVLGGEGSAVREGQHVQAGQVIVRLDDRIARANRAKFAAQLDDLAEQKKQAGFAVELAELEVKRLKDLRRTAGTGSLLVSKVEMDKAAIALKEAKSKELGVAGKEGALRAELKSLDEQLDYYTLRAPIAGTLGLVQVAAGQTLPVGTSVADVVDLSEIDVLCYAPPDTARRLQLNQTARLAGPAGEKDRPAGKVVFIGVYAQPETGSFAVKVRFPNPGQALRANAVVRVEVQTEPEEERVVVPEAALLEDQDPPAVVFVTDIKTEETKDGKKEKKGEALKLEVQVGVRDRTHGLVELKAVTPKKDKKGKPLTVSLKEAVVVTKGADGLEDGDKVKLEEPEEEGKEKGKD